MVMGMASCGICRFNMTLMHPGYEYDKIQCIYEGGIQVTFMKFDWFSLKSSDQSSAV